MIFLWWSTLFMSVLYSSEALTKHTFTAAVYEHARIDKTSAGTPESIIEANLIMYEKAAQVASEKGANIIVYPEYGIFSPNTREKLEHYLEDIPNPKTNPSVNPCDSADLFSDRPILYALSCIAKQNNLIVVANTGGLEACTGKPNCPEDGHYHFNANVAFDKNGTLVGRYYKEKLYFELGMDLPIEPQDPTFETHCGKFAMFICFDIVFEKMSEYALRSDIEAVLFSMMWLYAEPLMWSVGHWQAWSYGNNATFLGANINNPGYAGGSGIFNGRWGPLVYTYNPDSVSKLLVATIKGNQESPEMFPNTSITAITKDDVYDYVEDGKDVPNNCSKKTLITKANPENIFEVHDHRCPGIITVNYTFVKLTRPSGTVQACSNGMCCTAKYNASSMNENFYLGVFNGTRPSLNHYYWCEENCLIVRCEASEGKDCVIFPQDSETNFYELSLNANFSTPYVFPSVVLDRMRLAPVSEWGMHDSPNSDNEVILNYQSTSGNPLLVSGLYGRCYQRDPPYIR